MYLFSCLKHHYLKAKTRKRCLQKGDGSVIFGLIAIAAFCLGYYFTRDKEHEIVYIERWDWEIKTTFLPLHAKLPILASKNGNVGFPHSAWTSINWFPQISTEKSLASLCLNVFSISSFCYEKRKYFNFLTWRRKILNSVTSCYVVSTQFHTVGKHWFSDT